MAMIRNLVYPTDQPPTVLFNLTTTYVRTNYLLTSSSNSRTPGTPASYYSVLSPQHAGQSLRTSHNVLRTYG